jgi:hypothetical protein
MQLFSTNLKEQNDEWRVQNPPLRNVIPMENIHKKPSVLYITPTTPLLSATGGAMRAGMNILALSEIFEVHVLVLARFGMETDLVPEPRLAEKMASINFVEVHMHLRSYVKLKQTNLRVLAGLFMRPRSASKFSGHDISAILKILDGRKFDMIFFSRMSTGLLMESKAFRKWAENTPRVLDLDDIESKTALREAKAMGLKKGRVGHLADLLGAAKLAFIERRIFKQFNQVLVCSSGDQARMAQRHPKTSFGMLPNGFQVPAHLPERKEPDILTFLFIGSLQYPPNAEGVVFFCENVLPRLRLRLDQPFRLLIVGRNPSRKIMNLDRIPEVTVKANVPDVTPYYQSATIAIVPISFGGGTRIKILEAMSLGCPVVSTTLGAEGLDVRNGENILLADGASALADACTRLADDRSLRESLVQSGRDVVRSLYSAEAIAKHMADCVKAVMIQ